MIPLADRAGWVPPNAEAAENTKKQNAKSRQVEAMIVYVCVLHP